MQQTKSRKTHPSLLGVNEADMSLRANVSERGNPIDIIMHFTICQIVLMRLLRRFAPHNDMKLHRAGFLFN